MYSQEAQVKIQAEFSRAEAARNNGNEGQARVCARRAAGEAIRAYLLERDQPLPGPSAADLLNWIQHRPEMPDGVRKAAENLLVRVGPDFQLPIPIDLLEEARKIADFLGK